MEPAGIASTPTVVATRAGLAADLPLAPEHPPRLFLTVKIADAEAIAAEWKDADDCDLAAAVDLVRALQDADTAQALNATLSRALAGIYARVRCGRLRAEFELAADLLPDRRRAVHLFEHSQPVGLDARRITLGEPAKPGPSPSATDARYSSPLALVVQSSSRPVAGLSVAVTRKDQPSLQTHAR